MPEIISFTLVAFVVSYLGVGGFRLWAKRRQILDVPNARSSHEWPTPRGGGIVIVVVSLMGIWAFAYMLDGLAQWRALLFYTLGALLISNVSWLDDLRPVPSWLRFLAHCIGAVLAIAGMGYWQSLNLPTIGPFSLGWLGIPLTFLWLVVLTNAYNFMDGIDGIAGGQAVIAGLGWGIQGFMSGNPLVGAAGMIVAASSLGFLGHNWPPARIFMGDVGSAFLGYTFGVLPVFFCSLSGGGNCGGAVLFGALLVWPFLFDTAFTFLRRLKARENVFQAHKSHLYQRLVSTGVDPRSVTGLYIALALMGLILGEAWNPTSATGNVPGITTIPFLCVILWIVVVDHEHGSRLSANLFQTRMLKYRRIVIVLFQIVLMAATYYLSFLLRLDFDLAEPYRKVFLATLPLVLLTKLLVFSYFGLFSGWWRYVGMSDLLDIIKAATLSAPVIYGLVFWTHGFASFPRSVFIIDPILTIFLIGGTRFAVRAYYESTRLHLAHANALIVGAGSAGTTIAREIRGNPKLEFNVAGFVDDDRSKRGVKIQGIKVLGSTDDLPSLIVKHDVAHILIAIPSATGRQIQRIIEKCKECAVDFKTLPAIGDLINGSLSIRQMRNVRVEDLLVREPVRLELSRIRAKLQGKSVLITGAGGSIGSELARQIGEFGPEKLVLLDRSESDLFNVELELADRFPKLNIAAAIGDILDVARLREIFQDHRPHSVFHAAAYKHVPMMEKHCFQAVSNNVFGTYNAAFMAKQTGVEDFVMISSDKAVNPSNIMGTTKRVAELLILGLQHQSTRFVSVRFGNVLGSRGSVLPLFEQQIAKRKPITITHRDAKRYFMTTQEAVQLVLQASTMGQGGEIFVLDMGEPVRILDLARALLRISGLEPERDIPIVFTGLRPGEKLFEELKLDAEGLKPTSHRKIRVLDGGQVSYQQVTAWLDELAAIEESKNVHALVTKLKEIVPEYTPSQEILELCELDRYDRVSAYNRARAELPRG